MKIRTKETPLEGLLIIEIDYVEDERGFFIESWNRHEFEKMGIKVDYVQDSHSRSQKGTLRGLHFQNMAAPMAKLVRCTHGKVFDVAVDIRSRSKTFGKWFAIDLSAENKKLVFIPVGFAHGFEVTSDSAEVQYKQTAYYSPQNEVTIAWDDPDLKIDWPLKNPILSKKDKSGISLKDYLKQPFF